jgi:hypothetical protein
MSRWLRGPLQCRGVLRGYLFDAIGVCRLRLDEQVICLSIRRVKRIRGVEQVLDAHQDLLNCYTRAPALVRIQYAQANGPGWIHIWVKQRRRKATLWRA